MKSNPEKTILKNNANYKNILDEMVESPYYSVRLKAVEQGYGLDKLINDKHSKVRDKVLKQGYVL